MIIMKRLFLLLVILFVFIISGFSQQVYEANSSQSSHINFFVVSNMADADINVYVADSLCTIVKDGVWYHIADSSRARFIYMLVQSVGEADIKIFYVNSAQESGWRTMNKNKLYLNARKRK